MKLWKIEWDDAYPDETGLMIIRTETKEEAIELAKRDQLYYRAPYHKFKFDSGKWTIEELIIDGESGIIASR